MTPRCTSRRRRSTCSCSWFSKRPGPLRRAKSTSASGPARSSRRPTSSAHQGDSPGLAIRRSRRVIRTVHRLATPSGPVDGHASDRAATWPGVLARLERRDRARLTARTSSGATRTRSLRSTRPACPARTRASSSAHRRRVLEDRGSKNGTMVGDSTVAGATTLRDGDRLRFGTVSAVYRRSGAGMSTETHGGDGTRPARRGYASP